MRGHALQHGRGGGNEVHVIRDLDQLRGGHHGVFGVSAAGHGIRHAVAGCDLGDFGADGFDGAGGLRAGRHRKIGLVKPGAEIDIDEVDAAGGDAHQRLVGGGPRNGDVRQLQFFRTTGLVDLNGFHDSTSPKTALLRRRAGAPEAPPQRPAGVHNRRIEQQIE